MSRKIKIVIDANIPFIKGVFEQCANVVYLSAKEMTATAIKDADCLVVRTRTHCGRELLEGSNVKFIATATIGFDHIDVNYCEQKGIVWRNVPGCNAMSVGQYVGAALAYWAKERGRDLKATTMGIVGAGHVGIAVAEVAQLLGVKVLFNDPPRQRKEGDTGFYSLAHLAKECDVVSFHTPLTFDGEDATYHLGGKDFIHSLQQKPLIINAARGGVVDEQALLTGMKDGNVSDCIMDCWEGEPNVNGELLKKALIATPHIAGYSADGKANATERSVRHVSEFFALGLDNFRVELPQKTIVKAFDLERMLPKVYNIKADSDRLKQSPELFEQQRSHYPIRRECLID